MALSVSYIIIGLRSICQGMCFKAKIWRLLRAEFCCMVESPRILLICANMVARTWCDFYVFYGHFLVCAHVNVVETTLFRFPLVYVVAIWGWRHFCLFCLYTSQTC